MADTAIYRLVRDEPARQLKLLEKTNMKRQRLSEPRDLEAWLASSCQEELFGRKVLWIARQHWAATDMRSDLVGIEKGSGDMVVVELKRDTADESALTQALGYAAEYAELDYDGLLELWRKHGQKPDGLLAPLTEDDIKSGLRDAVRAESDDELNEYQVILVVAEDFSPTALTIADYLNNNSGDARYGLELWRYSIHVDPDGDRLYFMLEQVLPSFNARQEAERKRETAKARKRPRDSARMDYKEKALEYLQNRGFEVDKHWKQYSFCFRKSSWADGVEAKLSFERWQKTPVVTVPSDLPVDWKELSKAIVRSELPGCGTELSLQDEDSKRAAFTDGAWGPLLAALHHNPPAADQPGEGQEK